jgi:hypothetical protein
MAIKSKFPDRLQLRLTSTVELIRASLEPHMTWIEEVMGVPLDQTLTLEVDGEPGNAVAEPSADKDRFLLWGVNSLGRACLDIGYAVCSREGHVQMRCQLA